MRPLLVLALVLAAAYAKPNPQSDDAAKAADALDDVERTANSGGSYNANSGDIDPEVLKELFGNGGTNVNAVNSNYKPPKEENVKVDTTSIHCSDYKSQGFECVPYYECDENGEMIVDGGPGLIDIRGAFGVNIELDVEKSKCPGYLDVCCRHPDFWKPVVPNAPPTTTPKPTPPPPPRTPAPYVSKCGKHNKNGIGVRIQNYGGEAATQFGEWPHMCAVLERKKGKNHYVCGGSIIDEGIIMTAAHCVDTKDYANLKVRCGEWDTQRQIEPATHQDRDLYDMRVHPGYNKKNLTNDVALLFTETPFELGDHLDRVCLPSVDDLRDSYQWENCFATGWGKDQFGKEGSYQVVMKQVKMGLWNNDECQNAFRTTVLGPRFKLDHTALCAGGRNGADTCTGDGGGPLVCPTGSSFTDSYGSSIPIYVQAGIVGWGVGCGEEGIPGVYTDVAGMMCYIDWATRCVKGDSYSAYDNEGCGRRWAVAQRNKVWRARRVWQNRQREIGGAGRSKGVDRRVNEHTAAIEKWNAAINQCSEFKYADAFTDYGDDSYGGNDPYDDDYDDVNVGGYARKQQKQQVAPKTAADSSEKAEEKKAEENEEENEEDEGGDGVRFGSR